MPDWSTLDLAGLRRWAERFPEKVNEGRRYPYSDRTGNTILQHAVVRNEEVLEELLAFVKWLIDERGADLRIRHGDRQSPLCSACFPGLVGLLLDRGADPQALERDWWTPLMGHAYYLRVASVRRLLEECEGSCHGERAGAGQTRGNVARVHGVACYLGNAF